LRGSQRVIAVFRTLAIAWAGGAVATFLGMPASWLSGAMVATAAASLFRLDTRLPLTLIEVVMVLIGITLGAGVTPELIAGAGSWPLSLAGLAVSVVLCQIAVQAFLTRIAGWDARTSFFAAIPGALSYVLLLAESVRADVRQVAVAQSLRIFLLVAILPSLIAAVESQPMLAVVRPLADPPALILLLGAGAIASLVFRALRVPAAMLCGSLLASAVLHGTGWAAGNLPNPVIIAAFVVLGASVGARFAHTDLAYLKRVGLRLGRCIRRGDPGRRLMRGYRRGGSARAAATGARRLRAGRP
jgi:membrane AbrB-like protein